MLTFIGKVKNTIEKYNMINKNDHIILGLSGGGDSMALFHALNELKPLYSIKITAVHINHCIRGKEADSDEEFVKSICARHDVDLKTYRFDITGYAKKNGISIEEAGRIKRYEAFFETMKICNANKIAVAHNQNDQAETLLMRIIRGTGQKGLTGIPPVRENIIRPLIEISRNDIENYLNENSIQYRTDSTNNEQLYTRNKIRLSLIPYLQTEFNFEVIVCLTRLADICREENGFLDKLSLDAYNDVADGEQNSIDIEKLNSYDDVIKRRILRIFCENYSGLRDITYDHINDILKLCQNLTGKKINLPNGLTIQKSYGKLIFCKNNDAVDYFYSLDFGSNDEYSITFIKEISKYITIAQNKLESFNSLKNVWTAKLDKDKISTGFCIRNRRDGDRIFINHIGTQKLKKFFIDNKLSREKRDMHPLVCDDSGVIWIAGLRVSGLHEACEQTKNFITIQFWEE